jgi:glutaredoxin
MPYIIGLFFLLGASGSTCAQGLTEKPVLMVFHSPSCKHCVFVKQQVMPQVEKDFKGKIAIQYLDVGNIDNYRLLLSLKKQFKPELRINLPVLFISGEFLTGDSDIKKEIFAFLNGALVKSRPSGLFNLPAVDLIENFKSIYPLAIVGAGLIDGINPCAFSVIIFFISFLVLQGYRKRELFIIGMGFIAAVFLTYILLGVGVFGFLYSLKGFWLVIKAANLAIGFLSVILGLLAFADWMRYLKSKDAQESFLKLPDSVKNRIHKVIGNAYRRKNDQAVSKSMFKLIAAAFTTGIIVSLLEAVCTGQVYLPTISFVLKTTEFKMQAFLYLLLYNLMFILPLLVVFGFALLGVSSEKFALTFKKNFAVVKLLMAFLFLALGAFLIWRG